jgi:hypothetical protein
MMYSQYDILPLLLGKVSPDMGTASPAPYFLH